MRFVLFGNYAHSSEAIDTLREGMVGGSSFPALPSYASTSNGLHTRGIPERWTRQLGWRRDGWLRGINCLTGYRKHERAIIPGSFE